MDEGRFWLTLVFGCIILITGAVCSIVYISSRTDAKYIEAGYVQRVVITDKATSTSSSRSTVIWTKPGEVLGENAIELPVQEKK